MLPISDLLLCVNCPTNLILKHAIVVSHQFNLYYEYMLLSRDQNPPLITNREAVYMQNI